MHVVMLKKKLFFASYILKYYVRNGMMPGICLKLICGRREDVERVQIKMVHELIIVDFGWWVHRDLWGSCFSTLVYVLKCPQ